MSSIRLFLTAAILAVIILANFLAALHGYQKSMTKAEALFDNKLESLADFLSQESTNQPSVILPRQVDEKFTQSPSETLFQIVDDNGHLIDSSVYLNDNFNFPLTEQFSSTNFANSRWRQLVKYYPNKKHWVMVMEKEQIRYQLAESVILESVYPIVFAIPTIGLLIWLIIWRGLRPIDGLVKSVERRRSENLSPIELNESPKEIVRLVDGINGLLKRLKESFQREKRFSADAAHELRTPIAALNIQARNLISSVNKLFESESHDGKIKNKKADSNDEPMGVEQAQIVQDNLVALESGVQRMSHLVEQILTLNKVSPNISSTIKVEIDIVKKLQQSIANLYPLIEENQQEIALLMSDDTVSLKVLAEDFAVETLLTNLIGNAIKYTPLKGQIFAIVNQNVEKNQVCILDTGSGIPQEERRQLFEPFSRGKLIDKEAKVIGSGLGLAIVKQITQRYDISIELSDKLPKDIVDSMSSDDQSLIEQCKPHGLVVRLTFKQRL